MRIQELKLIAYGPFSDVTLDFGASREALHIVYGPNEAGKSSALRALRAVFFGIDVRTPDNFKHPHAKLRIGARLSRQGEKEIAFVRRKGRQKTLRDADDRAVLEETALQPFLGTVDRLLFEQMFAIGHDDLVSGGQEIVAGGGNIGQALFAAGAGLYRLQDFQQHLVAVCESLFKPSGSKPRINARIAELKAARKNQKDALLPAKTWKMHHDALGAARGQLAAVQQQLAELKQRRGKLSRFLEALPLIARKQEVDAALYGYADVPDLALDFPEKRRQAENALQIAAGDLQRVRMHVDEFAGQLENITVPASLLEQSDIIEALQHDLGSYRKAEQDRPGLVGRMRTLQQQVAQSVAEIGIVPPETGIGDFRLPPALVGDIQSQGKVFERLDTKLETAREQARKLAVRIETLTARRNALATPADTTAIAGVIKALHAAGPLEKQWQAARDMVARLEEELERWAERQSFWQGEPEKLDVTPFPSRERVEHFETRFQEAERRLEKISDERAAAKTEIGRITTELQAMSRVSDVPVEADLSAARMLRDNGWGLIRRRLAGDPPSREVVNDFTGQLGDGMELTDAFEKSMEQADLVADRLRREAERVSRKGLLEAQLSHYQTVMSENRAVFETETAERARLADQWTAAWFPVGVIPGTPQEMRAWLTDIRMMREKLDVLRAERDTAARLSLRISDFKQQLLSALQGSCQTADPQLPLEHLAWTAETWVARQEKLKADITELEKERAQLRTEHTDIATRLDALTREMTEWRRNWAALMAAIGLEPDNRPTAAMAVIEGIREARARQEKADELQSRIAGIDRDAGVFRDRVDALVAGLAPDLASEPADKAAMLLNGRLTTAREQQARQADLRERLEKAQDEQEAAQKRIVDAETRIRALCREAGCEQAGELMAVENRSAERRRLVAERNDLMERLRFLSAGATVEAFTTEASGIAADSIPPELEQIDKTIETLERERQTLDRTIGVETDTLKRMDGSAAAAGYAEESERLLAGLESDVEVYARTRIATLLLARTIETYREKHQGPLIARASALFAQMTNHAFSGVRAEYDESGKPVLVGVRPGDASLVNVAGMSDGSADQLYLSLRIAGLEQYLANNLPLPFVVDDILLRFDDDRSAATLDVLADLAEKTQVVFFTHHRHLVKLARERMPAEKLRLHTLNVS